MNDGSALPTLQVNEREAAERDTVHCASHLKKKEQLEENELCYVAWSTCVYDNISSVRDGMRCTESKLTFVYCRNNLQALPPVLLRTVLTSMEKHKSRTTLVKVFI